MFVSAPVLVLWLVAYVCVEQQRCSVDAAREFFAAQFPDDAAALVIDTHGEVVEDTIAY